MARLLLVVLTASLLQPLSAFSPPRKQVSEHPFTAQAVSPTSVISQRLDGFAAEWAARNRPLSIGSISISFSHFAASIPDTPAVTAYLKKKGNVEDFWKKAAHTLPPANRIARLTADPQDTNRFANHEDYFAFNIPPHQPYLVLNYRHEPIVGIKCHTAIVQDLMFHRIAHFVELEHGYLWEGLYVGERHAETFASAKKAYNFSLPDLARFFTAVEQRRRQGRPAPLNFFEQRLLDELLAAQLLSFSPDGTYYSTRTFMIFGITDGSSFPMFDHELNHMVWGLEPRYRLMGYRLWFSLTANRRKEILHKLSQILPYDFPSSLDLQVREFIAHFRNYEDLLLHPSFHEISWVKEIGQTAKGLDRYSRIYRESHEAVPASTYGATARLWKSFLQQTHQSLVVDEKAYSLIVEPRAAEAVLDYSILAAHEQKLQRHTHTWLMRMMMHNGLDWLNGMETYLYLLKTYVALVNKFSSFETRVLDTVRHQLHLYLSPYIALSIGVRNFLGGWSRELRVIKHQDRTLSVEGVVAFGQRAITVFPLLLQTDIAPKSWILSQLATETSDESSPTKSRTFQATYIPQHDFLDNLSTTFMYSLCVAFWEEAPPAEIRVALNTNAAQSVFKVFIENYESLYGLFGLTTIECVLAEALENGGNQPLNAQIFLQWFRDHLSEVNQINEDYLLNQLLLNGGMTDRFFLASG